MQSLFSNAISQLKFSEITTDSTVNPQVGPTSDNLLTDTTSKSIISVEQPTSQKYFKMPSAITPGELTSKKQLRSSSIIADFLDVKMQLQQILQTSSSQIILEQCKSLMASHDHDITRFSNEYLNTLKQCNVVSDILQKLSPFFSWSNHSVLTAVVEACNNPEAIMVLQQFDSQLDLSLPITEYPLPQPIPSMAPYDTSTETVFSVKLNTELKKFSFQRFLELQCLIQKCFQITEHSMQLMAAKSSSGILYWIVPKSIAHLINSKIMQDPGIYGSRIQELSIWPGTLFVNASSLQLGSLSFLSQFTHTVR